MGVGRITAVPTRLDRPASRDPKSIERKATGANACGAVCRGSRLGPPFASPAADLADPRCVDRPWIVPRERRGPLPRLGYGAGTAQRLYI